MNAMVMYGKAHELASGTEQSEFYCVEMDRYRRVGHVARSRYSYRRILYILEYDSFSAFVYI
jgi:hypothetical protein